MQIKPITPSQAIPEIAEELSRPGGVFDKINQLLAKPWDKNEWLRGRRMTVPVWSAAIMDHYTKAGWEVEIVDDPDEDNYYEFRFRPRQ